MIGKYIVFKDGTVSVFSVEQMHNEMTQGKEVESAGFYSKENNKIKTRGRSVSLNKESRETDALLIEQYEQQKNRGK